ncbi:MAG: heme o synthase [Polyangiales bacterium]
MVAPSHAPFAPPDRVSPAPLRVETTMRDVIALTKPRLMSLVLFTTVGGIWMAGASVATERAVLCVVGTLLAVAGAHTLNSWMERDSDALMERTRRRPLPAGRIDPRLALALGVFWSLASVPVLWLGVNPLTGLLGAVALISYVLVYTPMKSRSPAALHVGAIPGALPPLMGWTAVRNSLDAPGLALFAILFVWQLSHFLAIAIACKDDYARASMKTVAHVSGDAVASRHIGLYALALVPVTLALVPLGVAHGVYLAAAVALGLWFLSKALPGLVEPFDAARARRVFFGSLAHLTGLFLALIVDAWLTRPR